MTAATVARPPELPVLDLSFLDKPPLFQQRSLALASMLPTPPPPPRPAMPRYTRRLPPLPPRREEASPPQLEHVELTFVDLSTPKNEKKVPQNRPRVRFADVNEYYEPRGEQKCFYHDGETHIDEDRSGRFELSSSVEPEGFMVGRSDEGNSIDAWVDDLEKGDVDKRKVSESTLHKRNRNVLIGALGLAVATAIFVVVWHVVESVP